VSWRTVQLIGTLTVRVTEPFTVKVTETLTWVGYGKRKRVVGWTHRIRSSFLGRLGCLRSCLRLLRAVQLRSHGFDFLFERALSAQDVACTPQPEREREGSDCLHGTPQVTIATAD